ncbi:MAG: hypothetical protein Q9M40_08350 [Sulfurimonas sp.]|nr:hypothetical protein [Sulfurimonas sp.]
MSNIASFKNNKRLKCYSGGGFYSSANTYKVSKKDGWVLEKDYFVNKNLMIQALKCEVF